MDIASLGLEVRSDGVVVASDRLNKFGQDADRAEKATNSLSNAFRSLAPLVGAVMAAFSVRALREYGDAWSDMQSRVGAAIKNMEAAPAVMERIVEIANASYSPLSQTAEVFSRNMATLQDYGRGAMEAADFTEALNHALVITATKGQDADVVINSYSRAISNGKLRTMEFETIMSRSPRLLQAVADHMGVTITQLRRLAAEGKVTGEALIAGPTNALEKLAAEAAEMPATVGDAYQRISTNFQALIGRVDQATGSTQSFAASLIGLADRLRAGTDDIVRAAVVIQTGFNAAIEWASDAVSALGGQFDSASAMIVAGAGAAGFAASTLAAILASTLVGAIKLVTLALLANPFALLIGGISAAVTAAYLFRDEIAEIVGVDLFKVFYDGANTIIGHMKGAYDAVVAIWSHLPDQFSSIGKLAWNALMDGLGNIELDWTNPITGNTTRLLDFGFKGLKVELNETESYVEAVARAAYNAAQGIDYLKVASERVGETWRSVDTATASFDDLAAAAGNAGQTIDEKAAKAARRLAEAYKQIVDGAQDFIASQQLEASLIGMTEQAANALRYEFDLLNDAKRAGIDLTSKQRDQLIGLAHAMAEAEERTRFLTERFKFMKDLTTGFFNDFRSELVKNMGEGMSFWESAWSAMASAATRALDKIVDKIMNDLMDALFQVGNAGGGGGIFGMLGGLLGVGGGAFPSAPGGAAFSGFGGGLYQNGGWTGDSPVGRAAGIVHGQEFVVRAGPAAQHRQLLEAINSGRSVSANNNQLAAANGNQNVNISVNVEGANGDQHVIGLVQQGVSAALDEYDQSMPERIGGHLQTANRWGTVG